MSAPISHFTESPTSLAWSPDGRWLAFTMAAPAERKPLKVELPQAPQGASWADPPKLIDRLVYRIDGEGYLPPSFSQLFVIAAEGGPARQLTRGDFDHEGPPAWSSDSTALYISANRRPDVDYEPLDTEIYRVDIADGSIRALTDRRGPDTHPVVSPDGKHIAYLGFDDQRLGYQRTQLYVMDADGSHSHSLTEGLDRDAGEPQWSGDGKRILFEYGDRGRDQARKHRSERPRAYARERPGRRRRDTSLHGRIFHRRRVTAASRTCKPRPALHRRSPPEPAPETSSTLTALSANLLDQRTLGTLEEIDFDSSADGRKIQGWIVKPPHFDAAKMYPLLLEIHGGPFAAYGAELRGGACSCTPPRVMWSCT